ncbi:MAG: bifunctional phosphopantothenoylcysteine decarboxylase/phosphopantothenate--cysteine ligase CoaBC [Brumimicrobium sp.]|nr:bifunctional phosphopantothenoylcysteine decarboxylase/phosphopantothenate--cysteine ligase CoaBC [Brumimicrobium sp.]
MLKGKRIILGITGGIAAYKTNLLVRSLKKCGADVKCILTPASSDFVSPLTLSTLSENPVYQQFWNRENGEWTNHVSLAMWADLFVIAPLTANTLAKMAHGYCDNLLMATYLSAKCPVIVAPAMDLDMYAHPTTKQNLEIISGHGVKVIPAESGFLASGLEGQGRMAEPDTILENIQTFFSNQQILKGSRILITAGPTYESIDPVRFIGNHSSGKMGFAIAESCLKRGAEVILVTGPTECRLTHENLKVFPVRSADEMFETVKENFKNCNGGVFAAAVSDYRPVEIADQKIKKSDDKLILELQKNPDILAWAGENKSFGQWLVGFALETNDAKENALKKLKAKNLDAIVLNSLEDKGAGFGHDTNKITILDVNNNWFNFELSSKGRVAENILDFITDKLQ